MSAFVGGPLDGRGDYLIPPEREFEGSVFRVPWSEHYPGHPDYAWDIIDYQFDGEVWRLLERQSSTSTTEQASS